MADVYSVLSLWHTGVELVANSKVWEIQYLEHALPLKVGLYELSSLHSTLLCAFLFLMNKENSSLFKTL